MPPVLSDNLTRLCGEIRAFALPARLEHPHCHLLSDGMFLAHGFSPRAFGPICQSKALLSSRALGRPGPTEVAMGTDNYVFFYASVFRYPSTRIGLLFAHSLEHDHRDLARASPFDSGGLLDHIAVPEYDPNIWNKDKAREFLSRHELPVPGYREYLSRCLHALFDEPADYLRDGKQPAGGPINLRTRNGEPDERCWTHEVRIPDLVPLTGKCHLAALFAPRGWVDDRKEINEFLAWCEKNKLRVTMSAPKADFAILRKTCKRFILESLNCEVQSDEHL